MIILHLSLKSLWNRRAVAFLTIFAIAISVMLLLSVDKIRDGARDGFARTISDTDLIVGARTGPLQLLLYSVFRMGNATNNISWTSYQEIAQRPEISWTVPLSLGDSHRGFRVLATTEAYFEHFKYGRGTSLTLAEGARFDDMFDVVLGSAVAERLNYSLGQEIIISHGIGAIGFQNHDNLPFTVVGILAPTGTPVDQTLHITLDGMEAIHVGWERIGMTRPNLPSEAEVRQMDLTPQTITAFLVGLERRPFIFRLQRAINEYRAEPLLAILPGVALQEMWVIMATAERALIAISICVVVAGLLGMLSMILAGLNERRRELAILRSLGARPSHIIGLITAESAGLAAVGSLVGILFTQVALSFAAPFIETRYGLYLNLDPFGMTELVILGVVTAAAALIGLWPAIQAYRMSMADGLIVRV